jgi:hypothetical protein
LGDNIREWHNVGNVVGYAANVEEVWQGKLADFPNLEGHIDMLLFGLPYACQNGELRDLTIIDTSVDTVGSRDPALNLIAVTVQYFP